MASLKFIELTPDIIKKYTREGLDCRLKLPDSINAWEGFKLGRVYKSTTINGEDGIILFEEVKMYNNVMKSRRLHMSEINDKEIFIFSINVKTENKYKIRVILEENRYIYFFEDTVHKKFSKVKIECTIHSAGIVKQLLKGLYGK